MRYNPGYNLKILVFYGQDFGGVSGAMDLKNLRIGIPVTIKRSNGEILFCYLVFLPPGFYIRVTLKRGFVIW